MTPLPAASALDQFFLDARARILDVAATLDRLDRGEGTSAGDPRVEKLRKAVLILLEQSSGRAERIQQIFSLEYNPTWPVPKPRY
ncbi:MAG: hypothetical protein EXS09_16555 [Gemmataceae bacterium]|nr:hypothetical protein [Gemmataceae bacterium]